MKRHLKVLAFLTVSFMSNAFADTASHCSQASTSFLEVAREYQACNSITGSSLASCNRFCEEANKIVNYGSSTSSQQYCSPEQTRQIEQSARNQGVTQGRQQGRDEVLRDLQAREDFISADYYGINADDCAQRVLQATQGLRIQAIQKCNDKAVSIKNCYIVSEKSVGSFARPPIFQGSGNFKKDDNRSSEDECRKSAEGQAVAQALKSCQEATGSQCSIDTKQSMVNHRLQAPSGPRFGRRDDRICDAKVVAEAARDLGYKCNAKISARNQAFAN